MLPFVFTDDRFVFPVGAPQEVIKMTKASPKKTAIRINPPPILRSYTDGFSKYQCCELFAYILWDYMEASLRLFFSLVFFELDLEFLARFRQFDRIILVLFDALANAVFDPV